MLSVFWLRLYIAVPPSNDIKIKQEGGMNREPLVTSSNWGKTPLHLIFQALALLAANVNRLMNWISTTHYYLRLKSSFLRKKNISESNLMRWSLTPKKLHVSDMICLTKPLYQDQNEAIILEKKNWVLRGTIRWNSNSIRFKINLWELK